MRRFSLFDGHLDLAHSLWHQLLKGGETVIDATCGNGADTRLLARLVGPEGKVIACDLQEEAIASTKKEVENCPWVIFKLGCHSTLNEPCHLAVFNLGYLPGGDKTLTTRVATTLTSVQQLSSMLLPGGCLSITCYSGHKEGALEEEALLEWGKALSRDTWSCSHMRWLNRRACPSLIILQKSSYF
ncbi:MAG: methyltransferase domain-containing protein [Verrucomicrobia bacterium]|nr:methyltransferase domain-containing protein [Verrucomicrobiota bacterium]